MSSDKYTLTEAENQRVTNTKDLRSRGAASVEKLLSMLADSSWVVRRSVIEALAAFGEVSVQPLCDILIHDRTSEAKLAATVDALVASNGPVEKVIIPLAKSVNPAVAADVAQVLGRRRSPHSVNTLIELTNHPDDNVAVGAIESLGRIGGRAAVEALIAIVATKNFFRTFPAIDVLGRSSDPRAIEPLTKLLKDPTYLPEAARALGKLGESGSIPALMELLHNGSDSVVRIAAVSLQELQTRFEEKSGGEIAYIEGAIRAQVKLETVRKLSRVITGSDSDEAVAICKLIGTIGTEEAESILTSCLSQPGPVAVAAAQALKKISKNLDNAILQAIGDGNSPRRKVLLPLISKHSAAESISACLTDADAEVRSIACDTLARLGNPAVVKDLFPLLKDINLRVVHSATAAIQALGNREARQLAVEWSRSENPIVRRSCLRILTYFGDAMALEPMLTGLEDSDPRVREAAIQGLPYLEEPKAIGALYAICKNEDPRRRSLAMRALGQLPKKTEHTLSFLLKGLTDEDAWVKYYAAQSLGRMRYTSAAVDIVKLIQDPAGQVRVSAVEALSHLNVPEAHVALRLAAESSDVEVKRVAIVGLGISHRAEDLPLVLAAARSQDAPTKLIALSALVNFPSHTILGTLSTAASDTDTQVSSAAIELLAGLRTQEATEVLIELLHPQNTREKAREALLIPTEGRIPGILVSLESADDELADQLIIILSRLKRPEAKAALLAAMKLNNVAARKAAAGGLSARRDPEMLAALKEASEYDPSPEVRDICSLLIRQ